eukprot:tig00021135_g18962.t1
MRRLAQAIVFLAALAAVAAVGPAPDIAVTPVRMRLPKAIGLKLNDHDMRAGCKNEGLALAIACAHALARPRFAFSPPASLLQIHIRVTLTQATTGFDLQAANATCGPTLGAVLAYNDTGVILNATNPGRWEALVGGLQPSTTYVCWGKTRDTNGTWSGTKNNGLLDAANVDLGTAGAWDAAGKNASATTLSNATATPTATPSPTPNVTAATPTPSAIPTPTPIPIVLNVTITGLGGNLTAVNGTITFPSPAIFAPAVRPCVGYPIEIFISSESPAISRKAPSARVVSSTEIRFTPPSRSAVARFQRSLLQFATGVPYTITISSPTGSFPSVVLKNPVPILSAATTAQPLSWLLSATWLLLGLAAVLF